MYPNHSIDIFSEISFLSDLLILKKTHILRVKQDQRVAGRGFKVSGILKLVTLSTHAHHQFPDPKMKSTYWK